MLSSSREEIVAIFDALDAVIGRAGELSFDALTIRELVAMLERWETIRRRMPVVDHGLINQIAERADEAELGGRLPRALADRLRITRGDASRRVAEAADLGRRRALSGQPLPAPLSATAQAQRAGRIGAAHVQVIRTFLDRLPSGVDFETRDKAEEHLAKLATQFRPDQLARLADRLTDCLNPDGEFSDQDRARRRTLTLTKQDVDGMSRLSGWITPELRATLEAVWAKLAAPGMCNPDDHIPVIDDTADDETIARDARSNAQRHHDGLNAALRALLASGKLGQHNGLPATIIVTTNLKDLEAAAGKALTGGGSLLPMSDVIRLARHAHHYLAIFDGGRAVGLYHTGAWLHPASELCSTPMDVSVVHPRLRCPVALR
jgi:hypothetical protein